MPVRKIIKFLIGEKEREFELSTPKSDKATFELKLDDLVVGYLKAEEGEWLFKYSDVFKKQDEVLPLIDFPDKNKEYKSEELWPFFYSRIPGLGQPYVQKLLEKKNIDRTNIIDLLRMFGKLSISSPYKLYEIKAG